MFFRKNNLRVSGGCGGLGKMAEIVVDRLESKLAEMLSSSIIQSCRSEAELRGIILAKATAVVDREASDLLQVGPFDRSERKEQLVQNVYELLVNRALAQIMVTDSVESRLSEVA
jgi:hypothetical protein